MVDQKPNLPLIFAISSGIALVLLIVFTAITSYKRRLTRPLRLILGSTCVLGATGLLAFLLCQYGLQTKEVELSVGDQLVLAPNADADLNTHLFWSFCDSLRISMNKPGLTVWTAAVSPNRITGKTYTLLVQVPEESPLVVPLRLSSGDRLTVKSASEDTQLAVYAHERNWLEWRTAGLQQEAHETCCAWWQLRPVQKAATVDVQMHSLHRLILRGPPGPIEVAINRSSFEAAVCDPVVCDASLVKSCRLDVFEKASVMDVQVKEGSMSEFFNLTVWIECERKNWAIALLSSVIPLSSLLVMCLISLWRRQRRDRETYLTSPMYAYPEVQTIGGVGGAKQGVDFV
ncbi:unnamed protein product [Mesocestoides corti]|uniref:DUF5730 domain-containing protein n=1 Tax=Mesocestoides corti TaxID=53468 RepID=A0A158QV64_MESCO|nr:unnamed protein product [Mesocestoides corti]